MQKIEASVMARVMEGTRRRVAPAEAWTWKTAARMRNRDGQAPWTGAGGDQSDPRSILGALAIEADAAVPANADPALRGDRVAAIRESAMTEIAGAIRREFGVFNVPYWLGPEGIIAWWEYRDDVSHADVLTALDAAVYINVFRKGGDWFFEGPPHQDGQG